MTFLLRFEQPEIPVVSLADWCGGQMSVADCRCVAESFAATGVLFVRDWRVNSTTQARFRGVMERFFGLPAEELLRYDGAATNYQVGLTPPGSETARDWSTWAATLPPEHRPLTVPGVPDAKGRMMWPIGPRPKRSRWPNLNASLARVPAQFDWLQPDMDAWGNLMRQAGTELMELIAVGLDLGQRSIVRMMHNAPHLLGPTGGDFATHTQLGKVLAGLHNDFNLITIHGQTVIRALVAWTRDNKPFLVEVPDGCLLVQAGKQLEYLTGGYMVAGLHEVLVTPQALDDVARIRAAGGSTWRVSSNLFAHLGTRHVLRPLERFATREALRRYPPVYVGDYMMQELGQIGLATEEQVAPTRRLPPQYRRLMARANAA